jgi:rhodanese-related sulfurtransferase
MKLIDRDTLQRKLAGARPPLLAEALPEKYFHDWHLPGARHLPHDQVKALAPAALPDKAAEIVVYCASRTCQNSHIAARQLEALGYTDVAVYPGGKEDWSAAGLPVERGAQAVA